MNLRLLVLAELVVEPLRVQAVHVTGADTTSTT